MKFIKKHSILFEFLLFLVYVALCINDPYLTIICVQSIINAIAVIGIVLISVIPIKSTWDSLRSWGLAPIRLLF